MTMDEKELDHQLQHPNDKRVFAIGAAMKRGYTVDRIHDLTRIDRWFLCKLRNIIAMDKKLSGLKIEQIKAPLMLKAKQSGFSDKQIARLVGCEELLARKARKDMGITPFVKQIDTLAAEVA